LNCDLLKGAKISPENSGSPSAREWCCMYQFKWSLCTKMWSVGFRM